MSRNGSGTYSLPSGNPVVTGTTISSTTHNTTMSDIATALTTSIASDGQTTPTANLPMGGYKHTGVANGSSRTDYASLGQLQDSTAQLVTVTGTDTIVATSSPAVPAYATGQTFRFVSAGANTGAATLNINSLGAKAITKNGATALAAGDIPASSIVSLTYDGTQFQLTGSIGLTSAAIGVTVQAYDANTAKTNATQTFSTPQRGTLTTDNDLSFDLNATNYFSCTPSAGGTLTFTNIPSGQPVAIKLVNGSNYAIAAAATTKISTADLTKISATGTYLLTGLSDGTNVYLQASANIA